MAKKELKHIVVFEHQRLLVDQEGEYYLSERQHQALEAYYSNYSPFFTLIRNGVQFCEYVGVLQVGDTLIEILPKADKLTGNEAIKKWQKLLISMIRTVWGFPVKDSGTSDLKLKHNSVLDLYFELFVTEIEKLMHLGLIKKYIREERNATALKGKLAFTKHIQHNLVHQERFYIETTTYTQQHDLHRILYAALKLVSHLNRNVVLNSRIGNLLLNFPEQKSIKVNPSTFARLQYDRKSIVYKTALEIAELLLLNYHPDISKGHKNVLALMFDMNALWEQFVLCVLRRDLKGYTVNGQVSKRFWKSTETIASLSSSMRPDIVLLHKEKMEVFVLDTKWKNLNAKGPSTEDLRQMYVYHEYFDANMVALVYPGEELKVSGSYFKKQENKELDNKHCHIIQIPPDENFKVWKRKIVERIENMYN
jgi:5-methylcytosine-specific restriction enzyme subunit McrC